MFQTCLTKLAVTLRGVHPRRPLVFEEAQKIALVHGLRLMTLVQAGTFLWLAWLFSFTTTFFGQAVALAFLVTSLPFIIQIGLSLLHPTARVGAEGVVLDRMPLIALRRRRMPSGQFRLGLRPYQWSRSTGRRAQKRTETAFGWAFTLEHPRMLPVVLEMRWHGTDPDDLPDAAAAQARAADLARRLGLRRTCESPE